MSAASRLPWLLAGGAVLLSLHGHVVAQSNSLPQGLAGNAEERRRFERRLDENRLEVDRLLDLRLRYDLGLTSGLDENMVRSDIEPTATAMDRMRDELDDFVSGNGVLRQRYEQLRRQVEASRSSEPVASESKDPSGFETLPAIGSLPVGRRVTPADQMPARPIGEIPRPGAGRAVGGQRRVEVGTTSTAAPSTADASQELDAVLALDPLRAHIDGSKDHLRVAQALFKAGQSLFDRAATLREQGQEAVAAKIDARGKRRLEDAVKELQPLLEKPQPEFVTLFYLGRCRELLFRYSERCEGLSLEQPVEFQRRAAEVRKPFLQISARDVQKVGPAGSVEQLGPWGQAATTAMEHFRWMNQNGQYDQTSRIEALTWPGENRR